MPLCCVRATSSRPDWQTDGLNQSSLTTHHSPQITKCMKYEEAIKQLDEIVQKMENDEYDIDQLGEQMKKARELIKMCKDKLTKTDEEVQRMLKDE